MSCPTGKVGYGRRRDAQRARHRLRGEHVRPYTCPRCRRWHLGHLPGVVLRGAMAAEVAYGGGIHG